VLYEKENESIDPGFQQQKNREAFTNPYIKSLRKFFLKVHPDFFADKPKYQKCNQTSFQELNELLNWTSEYTDYASLPVEEQQTKPLLLHPPAAKHFIFYCRQQDQKSGHTKIESKFHMPENWAMDGSKLSARRIAKYVDNCLLHLLEQAGIAKPDITRKEWLLSEEDEKTHTNQRVNTNYLREEMRMALINNTQGKPIQKLKTGWWEDDIPSVDALINSKMLYLSRDITMTDSQKALDTLRRNIHRMEFYKWSNIPIMIGPENNYSVNEPAPGFITIPFNFNPKDFVSFLERNMDQLTSERMSTKDRAVQIQNLKSSIENDLKLSELTWNHNYIDLHGEVKQSSLTSTQILQALESIYNGVDEVKAKYGPILVGAHLTIGDNYQVISSDGMIMFKWDLKVSDSTNEVLGFLEYLGPKTIESCSKLTVALKKLREDSKKLGTEIVTRLACESLDVINHTKHSIGDKFNFLKKLQQQLLFLSKFNWSGYKFILADTDETGQEIKRISIDSNSKQVILCLNFGEEDMIRAVHEWAEEQNHLNNPDDDISLNPALMRNLEMMDDLIEVVMKDPDFDEFYGLDLFNQSDRKTSTESDEDGNEDQLDEFDRNEMEDDYNVRQLESMSTAEFRQLQEKEMEHSQSMLNKMLSSYKKQKKMIQDQRARDVETAKKRTDEELQKTDNPQKQIQLIEECQKYVKGRERSIEFRRVDAMGKINILADVIRDDIIDIYHQKELTRLAEEKQARDYQEFKKQRARLRLNYNISTGKPFLKYQDLIEQQKQKQQKQQQAK
jgi:hypothetical protein